MIKNLLIAVILFYCCSCISNLDIKIPEYPDKIVLNSVLKNDSIVKIELYRTGGVYDTTFLPVEDACIHLFEDDIMIPANVENKGMGSYSLPYTILPGRKMSIEIFAENTTISAETFTPYSPNIFADEISDFSTRQFEIEIDSANESVAAIYLYLFSVEEESYNEAEFTHESPYCNSPYADTFNAALSDDGPEGFFYSYDYFVRIDGLNLYKRKVKVKLASEFSSNYKKYVVKIISANRHYDDYFKSAYIQGSFDPEVDLPFTYYPVPVPSNISGGLGQFCAVDVQEFVF